MKRIIFLSIEISLFFNLSTQAQTVADNDTIVSSAGLKNHNRYFHSPKFMQEAKNLIKQIKFSGNMTLRLAELDYNQQRIDGKLHDRYRSRYRFYLNMDTQLSKAFALHARIRTGHKQWDFVDFGAQTEEKFNLILDQLSLDIKTGKYIFKIGRQSAIWKNQKGAQFDVPTHDGISAGMNYPLKSHLNLTVKAAYFDELYEGSNISLEEHGKIYGYQLAMKGGDYSNFSISQGLIFANHLPTRYINYASYPSGTDPVVYHQCDLAPDYSLFLAQAKLQFKKFKHLTFMADYYYNLKDYKINPVSHTIKDAHGRDSFTDLDAYDDKTATDFTNQKTGFIGTISLGEWNNPKGLKLGISYFYLEKYAVMDYFSRDDASRWASSNIKGWEADAAYWLSKFMNLRARWFLTEEIKGLSGVHPDFTRSGNRFRIDVTLNF